MSPGSSAHSCSYTHGTAANQPVDSGHRVQSSLDTAANIAIHLHSSSRCLPSLILESELCALQRLDGGQLIDERPNGSALLDLFGITLGFNPASPHRAAAAAPPLPRMSNYPPTSHTRLFRISATRNTAGKVAVTVGEVDAGFTSVCIGAGGRLIGLICSLAGRRT